MFCDRVAFYRSNLQVKRNVDRHSDPGLMMIVPWWSRNRPEYGFFKHSGEKLSFIRVSYRCIRILVDKVNFEHYLEIFRVPCSPLCSNVITDFNELFFPFLGKIYLKYGGSNFTFAPRNHPFPHCELKALRLRRVVKIQMFCDNTYDFNPQSSSGNIFEPKWHPVIDNGHSLHWEGSQVTDDTQKTGDNSSKLWLKLHSDLLLSKVYSTQLDSLLLYFSTVVLNMASFTLFFWHLKIC